MNGRVRERMNVRVRENEWEGERERMNVRVSE